MNKHTEHSQDKDNLNFIDEDAFNNLSFWKKG